MFFADLLNGMKTTFSHLFKKTVTIQYPTFRREVSPRFRGGLMLKKDMDESRCVSCCLCARYCPSEAIKITTYETLDHKKASEKFQVDLSRCIFCGFCVEACPKEALEMSHEYELACYNRRGLIYEKEILYKGPEITVYR